RARTARAGDGRGDVQGVLTAGRQHARSNADHAGIAGGDHVPAQRPGDPVPAPAQGRGRVDRRLLARARGGGPMTGALLPSEFSDLEPYATTWCLPTERERFAQRM